MYVVRLEIIGGIYGPFDTKEAAENYLACELGKVIEVIPVTQEHQL